MRRVLSLVVLATAACSAPPAPLPPDSGGPPLSCRSLAACPADQVCRAAVCTALAPCGDDAECLIGERCLSGQCRFTGCSGDSDCASGTCFTDTFTCGECRDSDDCPAERPRCSAARTCVGCTRDDECPAPGPRHCASGGACVACLTDAHCPNGLDCGANHVCVGVGEGEPCSAGAACAAGLVCIGTGAPQPICLRGCELYAPSCAAGAVCHYVTRGDALVFGLDGPLGVCAPPSLASRGLGQPCDGPQLRSTCRGDLACVPNSALASACRAFCNPLASGTCAANERCASFPGDGAGRRYGLCLPNDGYADVCTNDALCRAGLSCQPFDDPQSITDLSSRCGFDVGTKPGLAPCANAPLPDGGSAPDRSCKSGTCVNDPTNRSPPFYCFAACDSDADCTIGTRRGLCDASFQFRTSSGVLGSLSGCRPACGAFDECVEYGSGIACNVQFTRFLNPRFKATCGPKPGNGAPGEGCYAGFQCRSGYCSLDDGRGAQHTGYCSEPCTTAAQCANDAGTGLLPLACADTVVLGTYGRDGLGGTADDEHLVRSLCTGPPCATDLDCGPAGGTAICAPDADPTDPRTRLVQRCRPAEVGGKRAGESCMLEIECQSGVCGRRLLADGGTGTRLCFEACTATSACPAGTACRPGALQLQLAGGPVAVDSCAP